MAKSVSKGRARGLVPWHGELSEKQKYNPRASEDFAEIVTRWLHLKRSDWGRVLADPCTSQWALFRLNGMRRAVDEVELALKAAAAARAAKQGGAL